MELYGLSIGGYTDHKTPVSHGRLNQVQRQKQFAYQRQFELPEGGLRQQPD